jgi:transitional endoplasmic reticulum ATPase
VPSGICRRLSVIRWLSWQAASHAQMLFPRVGRFVRSGRSQAREESDSKFVCPAVTHRLVKISSLRLPFIAAIVVFPHGSFFTLSALIALQAFLWWMLLVSLRSMRWFLRKLLAMITFSCIVFDSMLVADFFQKHEVAGWTLASDQFGSILLVLCGVWGLGLLWILLSRSKSGRERVHVGMSQDRRSANPDQKAVSELCVPKVRFADVGGMEDAKQQIREVVEGRINPQKYARYGLNRNGILLYGPRGSGKTFLAESTAGEFGLNFHYVSPTRFITMWVGESEASIRGAFSRALANRPALLFIDEIDSLGSVRQNLGAGGDPGGAGRSYNNMAIELMQSIDQARTESGLIVMAATNVIDGLDDALVRDGRFDVKIHVDLPDEVTRERIFKAQLAAKPWSGFELKEFARRTPGASAAKIRSLVDQAAVFAARESRKIETGDLERAIEEYGGKDRPLFQPVEWEDVIVDQKIEQELRSLIRLAENPFAAERMGLRAPTGLLLLGPPGTGKTLIARLIATQSKRSFLPITSAEITEPKAVSRVFARARENSPSLIFMDEMDSLLPGNPGYLNQYYVQIIEQFLIEISALQPEHNVFLVGTTNRPENIDPRVLRGGRFSEKIDIGLPGRKEVVRLLTKYLKGVELEPAVGLDYLTEWLRGTTPANLEAMVATAKRYAFERSRDDRLAPLSLQDFERAAERVMGQVPPLPSARSAQA